MSRIGKKPVPLPKGVKAVLKDGNLEVTGPKGSLSQLMPPRVSVEHWSHGDHRDAPG